MKFITFVLLSLIFSTPVYSTDIINRLKNEFIVFDEMRFKNKPNLNHLRLEPIHVIYASELWHTKKVTAEPDTKHIKKLFIKKINPLNQLICLDIEHWDYDQRRAGPKDMKIAMDKYISVIDTIKTVRPELKIGYYGVPPIRDYFSPVRNRDPESWLKANKALTPLANKVDIVFPSLYTFYKSPDEWEKYALANIQEARKYGKVVVPFIWPQYHGSNRLRKNDYINGHFWRRQLELMYKHADGVVIWTPHAGGNIPWKENAEWWQATKSFLQDKNI